MQPTNIQTIQKHIKQRNLLIEILMEICLIVWIFQGVLCLAVVEGHSMEPTYHDGNFLLANRLDTPERGDIALFEEDNFKVVVKRIVGVGGDTISIRNGQVYLNEGVLVEPYVINQDSGSMCEIIIPDGYYFLAGDNRSHSTDSRNGLGLFSKKDFIGVVLFEFF